MFPEHVTAVLADLGYLALVIIAPCTIYNTIKNLTFGIVLDKHIELDDMRFSNTNREVGKLQSKVEDIRSTSEHATAERLHALMNP